MLVTQINSRTSKNKSTILAKKLSFLVGCFIAMQQDGFSVDQIIQETNNVRNRYGLSPLVKNQQLCQAAQTHSNNMAAYDTLNHNLINSPGDRINNQNYSYSSYAENIAYRYDRDYSAVVQQWVNSPDHFQNILSSQTEIGIGIAYTNSNKVFYTQVFATPASANFYNTNNDTTEESTDPDQLATIGYYHAYNLYGYNEGLKGAERYYKLAALAGSTLGWNNLRGLSYWYQERGHNTESIKINKWIEKNN